MDVELIADLARYIDDDRARESLPEPAEQAGRPRRRLGSFGVIDDRLDLGILHALGRTRPEWQIVMVGPVVKIDPVALPGRMLTYLCPLSLPALFLCVFFFASLRLCGRSS